jgi:ribosomal protein S16
MRAITELSEAQLKARRDVNAIVMAALKEHGTVALAARALRARSDQCPVADTSWAEVANAMEEGAAEERARLFAIFEMGRYDDPVISQAIKDGASPGETARRLLGRYDDPVISQAIKDGASPDETARRLLEAQRPGAPGMKTIGRAGEP